MKKFLMTLGKDIQESIENTDFSDSWRSFKDKLASTESICRFWNFCKYLFIFQIIAPGILFSLGIIDPKTYGADFYGTKLGNKTIYQILCYFKDEYSTHTSGFLRITTLILVFYIVWKLMSLECGKSDNLACIVSALAGAYLGTFIALASLMADSVAIFVWAFVLILIISSFWNNRLMQENEIIVKATAPVGKAVRIEKNE